MPHGLVHESEEKLRAHFFAHADPLSDWTKWAFGEFPKIDTAIINTVKGRVNGIKLWTLRYIDVEGQQCTGLVDNDEKICVVNEGLAREIHADECGNIGVRGIFSDPIRLPFISVNIKRAEEATVIMLPTVYKLCVSLPH